MSSEITIEHAVVFGNMRGEVFYKTIEWRRARYQAIKIHGNRCQLCGAGPQDGITLHVDHIKPRSLFPELCLDFNNLQVLCEDCHIAKGIEHFDDCRNDHTQVQPEKMRDFLRIARRHLVLEHRPPKTRQERDFFADGIRAPHKKHRKRWRAFVYFCFREQMTYAQAVRLTVSEFMQTTAAKNEQLIKFLWWGVDGPKEPDDLVFDIGGCPFPEMMADLLADDQK